MVRGTIMNVVKGRKEDEDGDEDEEVVSGG